MLKIGVLFSRDGVRRGGRCWVRICTGFVVGFDLQLRGWLHVPVHGEFGRPKKFCPRAWVWMMGLSHHVRWGSAKFGVTWIRKYFALSGVDPFSQLWWGTKTGRTKMFPACSSLAGFRVCCPFIAVASS